MNGLIKNFINGAISAYMTEVVKKSVDASLIKKQIEIAEVEI